MLWARILLALEGEQDGQRRIPEVGGSGRLGENIPLKEEDARTSISPESWLALQVTRAS
jgi:hypothetical protein